MTSKQAWLEIAEAFINTHKYDFRGICDVIEETDFGELIELLWRDYCHNTYHCEWTYWLEGTRRGVYTKELYDKEKQKANAVAWDDLIGGEK